MGNAAKPENSQIKKIATMDCFRSIFFRIVHTMPLNRSSDIRDRVDIAAIKHITLKNKILRKC